MLQTKFITLLKTLSNKEFNQFGLYLQSFYPKRKKDLIVFNYISKYKKNLSSKQLIISNALKSCFEKENIDKKNLLKNILPSLNQLLEDFLVWQEIKTDKYAFDKEKILLDIYKKRDIDKLFENKLHTLEKKLTKTDKDIWSYLNYFEIGYLNYFGFSHENHSIKSDIMIPLFENLTGFHITSLLKLACEQKFRERVIPGKKIPIPLLNEVLQLINTKEVYQKNKIIQIYLLLLDLIDYPNDNKYEELKNLVKQNYIFERQEDQPILYVFVLNYIANELKKGRENFIDEAKNWVIFGLNSELFLEDSHFPPIVFNNTIRICCGTKNIDLAETIVLKYGETIKKKYREDTLLVAKSYIRLAKKDFDTIIETIHPQKINHRIMNLQARLILLRAYGEKREWTKFSKFIEACYHSFRRTNYLSKANKKSALNTLRYAEKLANPNTNVEKFRQELKKLDFIFCKSWLLQQIIKRRI